MALIGYILAILGLVIIVLGLIAAALMLAPKRTTKGFASPAGSILDVIKAFPELVKQLTAAPTWLAMSLVGLLFIIIGAYLVAAAEPAPPTPPAVTTGG